MGLFGTDIHNNIQIDRDQLRQLVTVVINEWEMRGEGYRARLTAKADARGQVIAKLQRTVARQRRQMKRMRAHGRVVTWPTCAQRGVVEPCQAHPKTFTVTAGRTVLTSAGVAPTFAAVDPHVDSNTGNLTTRDKV